MTVARFPLSSDRSHTVVKSQNDKRLYRYLKLDNGLSTLLVHDPDIYPEGAEDTEHVGGGVSVNDDGENGEEEMSDGEDTEESCRGSDEEHSDECHFNENGGTKIDRSQAKKAAAAMCVGIGSFSDPKEAQGLTHFLEHMLFMGSVGFPDENEYDSYLSKHGGSSNAFTETEHTCYYFDVKREFLKGALSRFAQFFISPLVKVEAMEREVLAVDSEFKQVLQNDGCRLQQLQCHTTFSGHPFNKFFWGNKKSLIDAMENGIDLRAHVMKLYVDNYFGESMNLVIIGGESLDILETWVFELFGGVKKGTPPKMQPPKVLPIWESGKLYWLKAVKDVHMLELSWALPCLRDEYLKKPEDYLAFLLGHEGKGSLYYFLKTKGWVTSLSAGVGDEGLRQSSLAYVFSVSIRLTNSGSVKIFDIIDFSYQYLKVLRQLGPQEWVFKELRDMGNMEFRFAEDRPQDDYAADLSANLLVYPSEHVIYGDYAHNVWDEGLVTNILGYFRPDNMRVDFLSKDIEETNDTKVEPWFGSHYIEKDIPTHLLMRWNDPPVIDPSLGLPTKNEFIPSEFSIRADDRSLGDQGTTSGFPVCISDGPFLKLWYKLDDTFRVPRANAYFAITLKGSDENPRNSLLTSIFIKLLQDELNEIVYRASLAKLDVSISTVNDRVDLKVSGFNHKLSDLLLKITERVPGFRPSEDRFEVMKEEVERSLRNANMKPLEHATYSRLQLLFRDFWDTEEKLSALPDLSASDVAAFVPQLFSEVHIQCLCIGNMLRQEALDVSNAVAGMLTRGSLPPTEKRTERVLCLLPSADLVRDVRVKNPSETNSAVEMYFQLEHCREGDLFFELKAMIDLFGSIVEEPLFDRLRTKEQLGYVVHCGGRRTDGVHGFCFQLQSGKYDPAFLHRRLDGFVGSVEGMLAGMDEAAFRDHRDGVVAELLEKDHSLSYEAGKHWDQIVDRRYVFDMAEREAREVGRASREDVLRWYRTYMHPSSPKCRRLTVRVWGCHADMDAADDPSRRITDLAAFKASSVFYPVV